MKQTLKYAGFGLQCRECGYNGNGQFQLMRHLTTDSEYFVYCPKCWPAKHRKEMQDAVNRLDNIFKAFDFEKMFKKSKPTIM